MQIVEFLKSNKLLVLVILILLGVHLFDKKGEGFIGGYSGPTFDVNKCVANFAVKLGKPIEILSVVFVAKYTSATYVVINVKENSVEKSYNVVFRNDSSIMGSVNERVPKLFPPVHTLDYIYFYKQDSNGNDIKQSLHGISKNLEICKNDSTCVGFNTGGWLKNKITLGDQYNQEAPEQRGTYVKLPSPIVQPPPPTTTGSSSGNTGSSSGNTGSSSGNTGSSPPPTTIINKDTLLFSNSSKFKTPVRKMAIGGDDIPGYSSNTNLAIDQCAQACLDKPECKSFEYSRIDNRCNLNTTTAEEAAGKYTAYHDWDYYEKLPEDVINTDCDSGQVWNETLERCVDDATNNNPVGASCTVNANCTSEKCVGGVCVVNEEEEEEEEEDNESVKTNTCTLDNECIDGQICEGGECVDPYDYEEPDWGSFSPWSIEEEYKLSVNPIKTLSGKTAKECGDECSKDEKCLSFNFNTRTGTCELLPNDKSDETVSGNYVKDDDYNYFYPRSAGDRYKWVIIGSSIGGACLCILCIIILVVMMKKK